MAARQRAEQVKAQEKVERRRKRMEALVAEKTAAAAAAAAEKAAQDEVAVVKEFSSAPQPATNGPTDAADIESTLHAPPTKKARKGLVLKIKL